MNFLSKQIWPEVKKVAISIITAIAGLSVEATRTPNKYRISSPQTHT